MWHKRLNLVDTLRACLTIGVLYKMQWQPFFVQYSKKWVVTRQWCQSCFRPANSKLVLLAWMKLNMSLVQNQMYGFVSFNIDKITVKPSPEWHYFLHNFNRVKLWKLRKKKNKPQTQCDRLCEYCFISVITYVYATTHKWEYSHVDSKEVYLQNYHATSNLAHLALAS